ncbi:phosphoglycerate mutase-like protein [Suhomyces tanzawaensis NRRL Y-17324]|uniref:Phosphoglycerate mutase-like protein n=1 Tax=Suhomyces tanzawaensis NRRL Y-17324 TaxID=984487 RepID=A0A1E4SIX8_9ASCO|nr:phosphoglycerate mutase-like protein [Suhomyces tanzawaensis NRRL Y-17324]ODV79397.1 phosphoglycerate mutase-like protein [Suhomyces tanzawaensis NRRL Y-17324]
MARPKYILLVRHGESEGNCDKSVNRFTPNHNVALTQQGQAQATDAGLVLKQFFEQPCFKDSKKSKTVLFYTSPYLRARQTCHNIVNGIKDVPDIDYSIYEEPRMREQDFGNFQSTPEAMEKIWEERAHYGHFFYRIPHGESAADVYDRVASFNESLFRQFQQDDFPNVLVLVTHGIWARVFLMKWFRWTYEEFESLKNIPHCQYLIMKQDPQSGKFALKTPLLTWDDLPESEIDEEITKEVGEEVSFNSKNKLSQPDDLDIHSIIEAQRLAIKYNRDKNKKIKEAFEQAKGQSNGRANFQTDNQSEFNSKELLVDSGR